MADTDFLQRDEQDSSNFSDIDEFSAPRQPKKKLIIVTCMDHRVDPVKIFDLKHEDVHVIRNAGGLTRDALRSIIISQRYLRTENIYVLQHTRCGMQGVSNFQIRDRIIKETPGDAAIVSAIDFDFKPFTDLDQSVRDNLQFLRHHPLVQTNGRLEGYVYDVETKEKPPRQVV